MDLEYTNETCGKEHIWLHVSYDNPSRLCSGFLCHIKDIIVITLVLLVLIGNSVNLIIIVLTKSLRNSHGYLLTSLTCADLGLGLSSCLAIYPAIKHSGLNGWPYSCTTCLLMAYFSHIFKLVSSMTLVFLSLERYVAVVHPLKYSLLVTKKATLIAILISWIVAAVFYSPVFADNLLGFEYMPEMYFCIPAYFRSTAFSLIYLFAIGFPYLLTIIVTTVKVRITLVKSRRQREIMTMASTGDNPVTRRQDVDASSKQTVKLFRMVTLMAIAGCTFWILIFITNTIVFWSEGKLVPDFVMFLSHWLVIANSFINVIIYFAMNKTFRDRGVELLKTVLSRFCARVCIHTLLGRKRNEVDSEYTLNCHPNRQQSDVQCLERVDHRRNMSIQELPV